MTAAATTATTDLIALPAKETALAVFTAANGTDPYLTQIRAEVDAFVPDVSTRKGREAIASLAYRISRSKTALDNVGKELVAEQKKVPALIDAERKRMRDTLDTWRDEVRAPLDQWEMAEQSRKSLHEAGIDELRQFGEGLVELSAEAIGERIARVEGIIVDAKWEEFEAEAARAQVKTLRTLRSALGQRQQHEAEQAELARLRAEQAERERIEREQRIAEEAAEKVRREEADRAERERLAAEKREAELKLQAERADREKLEAQHRAEEAERNAAAQAEQAAERERQRIAAEREAEAEAARQREADTQNKLRVMTAIKEALMVTGISEDHARACVHLIRKGQVPHVTITY